jgi:putative pyruvate formate lyase activating enzyme
MRVAYVGPHFGEEPPLTGKNGSGTVFFAGCTLRCSFCQNHQISQGLVGKPFDLKELYQKVEEMILCHAVHNVNFVTPDHFFPHVFSLVSLIRKNGFQLPMVFNFSGYQSVEILKKADDFADIYLPDFKYGDPSLAQRLSRCRDYPRVALEAVSEMVRQKGFLDAWKKDGDLAAKGVLVRHLILPGHVESSLKALTMLFLEFGPDLPLSIMSQYYPVIHQKDPELNRFIHQKEFERVYDHVQELGFTRLFVQFPSQDQNLSEEVHPFLPDFQQEQPFG